MAINKSKVKDDRFWSKWRWAGAVEPMVKIDMPCLCCDTTKKETVPLSWSGACFICPECGEKAVEVS